MKNIKPNFFELLFPQVRAELLRLLFDSSRECSVRELARSSDLALRTVQRELAVLEKAGLIISRDNGPGRRRFVRANRHHRAFAALKQLVMKGAAKPGTRGKAKKPRQKWRWSVRRLRK
jgi:DNA-binding transcriptional ArsR family regulator